MKQKKDKEPNTTAIQLSFEALLQDRSNRDEHHLAAYPIALLSYKKQHGKTIRQEREVTHKLTKKKIKAVWEVLGTDKYGLPTPTDDLVLLALIEMARQRNFPERMIFTRRELLTLLDWPDNQKYYGMLELALIRLSTTNIRSENVFWDKTAKIYMNTTDQLIHELETPEKKAGRKAKDKPEHLCSFKWGKPLYQSFQQGFLKPLSLSFIFSLKLPLSRRLYRYLDLIKWDGKPSYRIGLEKLCLDYLAISQAQYPSVYKHTLQPAHDELITTGFLRSAQFEESKSTDGWNVHYVFGEAKAPDSLPEPRPQQDNKRPDNLNDDQWIAQCCDQLLEQIKDDDPAEWERIHTEAINNLGVMERAKLEREPDNSGVVRSIREHMHAIVSLEHGAELHQLVHGR